MLSRFRESESILQPALHRRNQLYARWLATKYPADLGRYHRARAEARQAIRATKNACFQDKAERHREEDLVGKQCGNASELCSMEEEV